MADEDRTRREAEEFFYLDENGNKQDRDLHGPIIAAGERRLGLREPIREDIMGPIRARNRAAWLAKQPWFKGDRGTRAAVAKLGADQDNKRQEDLPQSPVLKAWADPERREAVIQQYMKDYNLSHEEAVAQLEAAGF